MVDLCRVVRWSGIQMVVWKPDWKKPVCGPKRLVFEWSIKSRDFTIWIQYAHTVRYPGVRYSDFYRMSAFQMFQFPKSVHASSFNYGEKTFAQNFAARPWCFTFEDKQFILEICRKHDTGLTRLERVVLLNKKQFLFVQWRVALPCSSMGLDFFNLTSFFMQ